MWLRFQQNLIEMWWVKKFYSWRRIGIPWIMILYSGVILKNKVFDLFHYLENIPSLVLHLYSKIKDGEKWIYSKTGSILSFNSFILAPPNTLGGANMIPVCWDKISTRPAGIDFTLRLHVEIKFCPGKAGQFSTWHLLRFVLTKFVHTKLKFHRFSLISIFLLELLSRAVLCLFFFIK